jgi:RES domain-containing protein
MRVRAVLTEASPLSIPSAIVTRFTAEVYRGSLGSPDGATRRGGRYNSIGVPAIYTSYARVTALLESTQDFEDDRPMPISCMYSLGARLDRVIDVSDPATIAALGTTKAALCDIRIPGRPFFAQVIGDEAFALGIDGLIAWSAQDPDRKNLVILPHVRHAQLPYLIVSEPKRIVTGIARAAESEDILVVSEGGFVMGEVKSIRKPPP